VRVRRAKPLAGKVVSPLGPVAGATVEVLPLRPPGGLPYRRRTDLGGAFEVQIPPDTEVAAAVVSPPGYALRAFAVPAEGSPVLEVSREGGNLEVIVPLSEEEIAEEGWAVSYFQNGLPLSTQTLLEWARGHGQAFVRPGLSRRYAPNLAPGEYRACLESWTVDRPAPRESVCATGTLAPGATLRLELPGGK
jgi:hypothetical protein